MLAGIELIRLSEPVIRVIAADMRDEDKNEVWASHHLTPYDALKMSMGVSDFATVVQVDGVPCAAYGLIKRCLVTGAGTPWMLASNHAMKYKREFLLQSPPIIREMLSICPRLVNHVHADNRTSIRWLKWLGFTIEEPLPVGFDGAMFHRFHLTRT